MPTPRIKIAIACQGGGSQTAFTAGVPKGLFGFSNRCRDPRRPRNTSR